MGLVGSCQRASSWNRILGGNGPGEARVWDTPMGGRSSKQPWLPDSEEEESFWETGDLRRGSRWVVQNLGVAQAGAHCPRLLPHCIYPLLRKREKRGNRRREGEEEKREKMEGNVPLTPDTGDQGGGGHLDFRLPG